MNISERLIRREEQDILEIGNIIKATYYGQFGEVLKAIVDGLITYDLTLNQRNERDVVPLSSDRLLGRLEGYQTVINKLELAIQEADSLREPIEEDEDD